MFAELQKFDEAVISAVQGETTGVDLSFMAMLCMCTCDAYYLRRILILLLVYLVLLLRLVLLCELSLFVYCAN